PLAMKMRPAMLPCMARKPTIALIGPGRLGAPLAMQLGRAGYRIAEIVSRTAVGAKSALPLARALKAHSSTIANARLDAQIIWFCIPDSKVASLAAELAKRGNWKGKTVFHSSGVLDSGVLSPLRKRGASVASVHPMMTFVKGTTSTMKGIT